MARMMRLRRSGTDASGRMRQPSLHHLVHVVTKLGDWTTCADPECGVWQTCTKGHACLSNRRDPNVDAPFQGWAVLELMGHRQRPGFVQEVEIGGGKMLRVDIPVGHDEAGQDRMVTEFYSTAALYALRPCTEDVIREEIKRYGADPRPVRPLDFKERAPKAVTHEEGGDDDDFDLDNIPG